jgi:CTP:molybdopterin cytidylyltransferase MocA
MHPGAVIAAGRSSRMGRSKALLPFGRSYPVTFLRQIAETMLHAGLDDILIVGRPEDEELRRAVERLPLRTRYIPNPSHHRGQLSSIVAAVKTVDRPGVHGLVVMPVDMPLVRLETWRRLLEVSSINPTSIVRPACGGRHGHPVIFDRGSFEALLRADPAVGAKSVIRAHAGQVLNVEVEDEGVLNDIDSMEDYVRAFGGSPDSFETADPASGTSGRGRG